MFPRATAFPFALPMQISKQPTNQPKTFAPTSVGGWENALSPRDEQFGIILKVKVEYDTY